MMAASAEMGLRVTVLPALMSTITSSPFWQTVMNLSLSREHVPNLMASGATPSVTNCSSALYRKRERTEDIQASEQISDAAFHSRMNTLMSTANRLHAQM